MVHECMILLIFRNPIAKRWLILSETCVNARLNSFFRIPCLFRFTVLGLLGQYPWAGCELITTQNKRDNQVVILYGVESDSAHADPSGSRPRLRAVRRHLPLGRRDYVIASCASSFAVHLGTVKRTTLLFV